MSTTPTVDQLRAADEKKQIAETIAKCKKFMTKDSLDWVTKFPDATKVVMHPLALAAYDQVGTGVGYDPTIDAKGGKAYRAKINGKPVGVLPTLQLNQILLVDLDDNILCGVFLSMNPPKAAQDKPRIIQ